jgi:hypothetical protein
MSGAAYSLTRKKNSCESSFKRAKAFLRRVHVLRNSFGLIAVLTEVKLNATKIKSSAVSFVFN